MVLINIKIFNKFENLVILLSEQKFGDFGGGDYISDSIWLKNFQIPQNKTYFTENLKLSIIELNLM